MNTAIREGGKLSAMATPTVRRLQLGKELARLRARANVRVDQAAKAIEKTGPVISRLEHGETGLRRLELRELLEFYAERIADGEPVDIEWFLEFNKGAENRGRWDGYRSVHAKWFRMAVDLEADADTIDIYQTELIFGLFQTEDYMRSIFAPDSPNSASAHIDDFIGARLERQKILSKSDAPDITVIFSESAIVRLNGTPKVMSDQLTHLVKLTENPNIQIHVLPFRSPRAPVDGSPFIQFRIPALDPNAPPLNFVYVETLTNAEYLDGNSELAQYHKLWGGLLGASLDQATSKDFLIRVAKEFR